MPPLPLNLSDPRRICRLEALTEQAIAGGPPQPWQLAALVPEGCRNPAAVLAALAAMIVGEAARRTAETAPAKPSPRCIPAPLPKKPRKKSAPPGKFLPGPRF
jgi:hypothetical protein